MDNQRITIFICDTSEEAMLARLAEDYREEMLQRDMDEDSEVRLTALDCERCRSPVDHVLTMSAGEAVCDGCIDAELSE